MSPFLYTPLKTHHTLPFSLHTTHAHPPPTCPTAHRTLTGGTDEPHREPRVGGAGLRGHRQARHCQGHQVPEQGAAGESCYSRVIVGVSDAF